MSFSGDPRVSHRQRIWLYVLNALTLAFLIIPIFIVIPISFSASSFLEFPPKEWSFRWYENFFGTLEWREATFVSLRVAFLTVIFSVPTGIAAAYALHVRGFFGVRAMQLLMLSPLLVPVILIAVGIFYVYAKLGLVNTITGLVMAHTMMAVPFVVVTIGAGLQGYDMNQERVARSLGANRLAAFLQITLPQIKFSVISASLLAFITSLDEVVIALFISGGSNATLTRRMFNALRDQIDPTIAAISSTLIVLSISLALLAQAFAKRSNPSGQ